MGNSSSNLCVTDVSTQKNTDRGSVGDEASGDINKVRCGVSGMQGVRPTMEDKHIMSLGIPVGATGTLELKDHCLFGVFDGHGGDYTSHFLEAKFVSVFSERPELIKYESLPKTGNKSQSEVNGVLLLKQALSKTFEQLDEMLLPLQEARNAAFASEHLPPTMLPESDTESDDDTPFVFKHTPRAMSQIERSGSTAVVVLLTPTHILCANAGDSRAILRRNGKILPLSFDHKPSELPERQRIAAVGGIVKARRVDGDLAVSRAFGDFVYKQNKDLPANQQKVIVEPDVMIYPRDMAGDEFLVLACDGIWDVATNEECAQYIQLMLAEGETDLGCICEEVLDTCLERNSRDNMTLMLVGLSAMKFSDTKSIKPVWGSRASRAAKKMTNSTMDVTTIACGSVTSGVTKMERALCSQ